MSNPYPPQQPGQYPQQQPGVPPQGGFPQQAPYPNQGYSSQPPRRGMSPKLKRSLISIAVLVVIGGGLLAYNAFKNKDSATKASVGDCITAGTTNPKIVGCGSSDAAFKVLEKHDNTNDTEVCDTDAVKNAGGVAGFYWHGDGKGLLCVGVTSHTTLKELQGVPGLEMATQDDLTSLQAKAGGSGGNSSGAPSDSSS